MNVNFILNYGELNPGYLRAMRSAKVHGAPIVLWHVGPPPEVPEGIELRPVTVPTWLEGRWPQHVKDVLALQLAHEHGGMFLDLDTISLKPAWDLLGNLDMVLSRDWAPGDDNVGKRNGMEHPYNILFIAKPKTEITRLLCQEAKRRILVEEEVWGYTGPLLFSEFVAKYPDKINGCSYPDLCGWAPGYIWKFYLGLETPAPSVRVIHLFRSAYDLLYEGRYNEWLAKHASMQCWPFPRFDELKRTGVNDHLLLS